LLAAELNSSRKAWDDANKKFIASPPTIVDRVATMKKQASSEFSSDTESPMNNRERAFFISGAKDSILLKYNQLLGEQTECGRAMGDFRALLNRVAAQFNTSPSPMPSDGSGPGAVSAQNHESEYPPVFNFARLSLNNSCALNDTDEVRFAHLSPKTSWGPFGSLANWLIQTKSAAVALITGMIGFGLVGSVLATLLHPIPGGKSASLISETASVLVRGFSAAIVIFLAVQGGIAAFSTGEGQPNAYVLFFTCLVGAVFSEDVWVWAHKKALFNLSGTRNGADEPRTVADSLDRRAEVQGVEGAKTGRNDP
jgi:hypothetical protein